MSRSDVLFVCGFQIHVAEFVGSEKGSGTNSAQHPSGHLAIGS